MIKSNTRAILYLQLCLVSFLLGDTLLKMLFNSVPVAQLVWFRTLASILALLIFIVSTGRMHLLKTSNPVQHLFRSLFFGLISVGYYLSVKYFPLSVVAAALAGAPILIAAISPFILGEKANKIQWIATISGFIGVCFVLRLDTEGFSWVDISLLSLPFSYAVLILWGRKLSKTDSDWSINFYQFIPLLIAASFWEQDQWIPISSLQLVGMLVSGIAGAIGFMLLIAAFRIAKPVVIAPFEYSYILMALAIDILFWHLIPDTLICIGITLIVLCGIIQGWQSNIDNTINTDSTGLKDS